MHAVCLCYASVYVHVRTYTCTCTCTCNASCTLSDVLRGYAQEADGRYLRDTPSSFSGHMGAGMLSSFLLIHPLIPSLPSSLPPLPPSPPSLIPSGLGPRYYTVHLRAVLLLEFMEHLDKLMYNAYEGTCVTLPPVPKVRTRVSVTCTVIHC